MSSLFWSSTSEKLLNNRYKIQRELGCNAGRYTFLAKDLQNQQLVVIKLIVFNHDFQWESLKLFEREVEILKSLSHPAIPRYIEYFEVNIPHWNGFAFVQNYIEAESLEEHLRNGRTFSESEVKQLAKTLLGILNYLHSHNPSVIHRDIKPSNILLSNSSAHSIGDIYLVDFGSVQNVNHQEGTITIVGTYGYMPPEQFVGRAFPASDLYSLGITIIYLISGTEVEDLTQEDWQFIQLEQLSNISSKFRDWLKLMTHRSLKKRFRSVTESLEALESTTSTLEKYPLSKAIFIKTEDSLKITVPFIPSKNVQKSDLGSVREIHNYQQLKSQTEKNGDMISLLFSIFSLVLFFVSAIISYFIMRLTVTHLIPINNFFLFHTLWFFIIPLVYVIFSPLLSKFNSYITRDSNYIDSLNLQITQHDITFSYTYYKTQKIRAVFQHPREKISHLILERKSYKIVDAEPTRENEVPPDLCLQVNGEKYGLNLQISTMLQTPENHKLTEPEIYWLAEEVSIFLDIPITWV
jgi:serine/threonine protein kinase